MAYYKLIKCGHVLEVYRYEKSPTGIANEIEKQEVEKGKEWIYETGKESPEEYNKKNANVRRNKLRRMILANFSENSKFITLTFKSNITDLDFANTEFKKFIQRLRSKWKDFRYIAVIEFQKRGAVHYHMISDLPYIQKGLLQALWYNCKISKSKNSKFYCVGSVPDGHHTGFLRINNILHVDNVGAYIVKYMTKESDNPILAGRKTYLYSQNLLRESSIRGEDVLDILESYDLVHRVPDENGERHIIFKDPVFHNEYDTEFLGRASYREYNLKRIEGK